MEPQSRITRTSGNLKEKVEMDWSHSQKKRRYN